MGQASHPEIVETPNVEAMTTTASAAIAIGQSTNGVWFTVISEAIAYIKIGGSSVDDPDETATSGAGRCWRIPADTEWTKHLRADQTHFKIKGDAAAQFRWYVEEAT